MALIQNQMLQQDAMGTNKTAVKPQPPKPPQSPKPPTAPGEPPRKSYGGDINQIQTESQQQALNTSKAEAAPGYDGSGINPGAGKPGPAPADQYQAPTTTPVTSEVDRSGTVEGRLNDITAKGSRYTDLAAADARRNANSRGLINSSMAAAAGTEAAIRSALPIAQQDATTFDTNRRANTDIQNKFLENKQNTDLGKESAAFGSQLTKDEQTLLNDLSMKRDKGLSELTEEEMKTLKDLEMKRDAAASELTKGEMVLGSGLTKEEESLRNELTMKRDEGLSELTKEEEILLNELEMKRDAASSDLTKDEMILGSGLTKEEEILRNDLTMKRDEGLSELTREEQILLNELDMKRDEALSGLSQDEMKTLKDLEMKRDAGQSALTIEEQRVLNELTIKRDDNLSKNAIDEMTAGAALDINRDNNSANLNESLSKLESELRKGEMKWDSELKTKFEQILSDDRFDDNAKIQIVNTMESITRDANAQITQISLSDRKPAQQAAAILRIEQSRDAQLGVYEALLSNSDWDWGTDFTPGGVTAPVNPPPPAPAPDFGSINDRLQEDHGGGPN